MRMRKFYCVAFIAGCCICFYGAVTAFRDTGEDRQGSSELHSVSFSFELENIELDGLYSRCAVLMDAATGQVIAEKNSKTRIYPASMTKLMAALVAAERTEDWDVTVEIPHEIFSKLYIEHASLAGFEPGEQVTPEELLYGMLLPSGAECCSTYAVWLAGDEKTFVEWMNEKAEDLNLKNTHFVNTSGLHDGKHYSTAQDMAVLLQECLKNDTLRCILSAESFQTASTAFHPQGITLESTLFQTIAQNRKLTELKTAGEMEGAVLLGGKTGYTSQAGLCLASFAAVNGREYILVTAGAEGNHYTEPFHIEDALAVYGKIAAAVEGAE